MQSSERASRIGYGNTPSGEQSVSAHPVGDDVEPGAYEEEEAHVHLAPQSIWPMTVAAGVALGTGGLVSTWPISVIGLVLMFLGITMWIQELRHELH